MELLRNLCQPAVAMRRGDEGTREYWPGRAVYKFADGHDVVLSGAVELS